MKRYLIVFLILSALLILAAGCGSEGSTEAAEAESNEAAEADPVEEEQTEEGQLDEHEEGEDEHMDDHEEGEDEHIDEHEEGEDEHMDDHAEGEDEHMEGEADQMDHMHAETPGEFASLSNPFSGDADAIAEGQKIFDTLCVRCHGEKGLGDGRDGKIFNMDPKPANLADRDMMGDMSDGYLFWRVSKGGEFEPFNSAMPAWEGLPEEVRWKVISYVRTLSEG
jgi:mono/diheme cytochrome c family protein